MKKNNLISNTSFKFSFFVIAMVLAILPAFSQLEIEVGVDKKEWYEQPWAWVAGAAVFILLLAAILRGGRKR